MNEPRKCLIDEWYKLLLSLNFPKINIEFILRWSLVGFTINSTDSGKIFFNLSMRCCIFLHRQNRWRIRWSLRSVNKQRSMGCLMSTSFRFQLHFNRRFCRQWRLNSMKMIMLVMQISSWNFPYRRGFILSYPFAVLKLLWQWY